MIKLGEASAEAIINAGPAAIDLGEWLFTLTAEDYAACAEGHQSAAQARLPSGKRVSLNVETVAGYFMVQHYIEKIAEKDRVLSVSPNTLLWLDDECFVLLQITWELFVTPIDDQHCRLTCKVTSETANEQFAQTIQARTSEVEHSETPLQLHILEETPLFAKDIERKARTGVWQQPSGESQ
ncbi:MAG: hypothetical protein AAF598_20065 [Bacteroidota bacterium]